MNEDDEVSLVVKGGRRCAYTKENSENGNQKATSEYGVSFKQKWLTIILLCNFLFLASHCFRSVEPSYKNNQQI